MNEYTKLAKASKKASQQLARLTTEQKNKVLKMLAQELERQSSRLLAANQQDIDKARKLGLSEALLDRIKLDSSRIQDMLTAIATIEALPDPVGRCSEQQRLAHGLEVAKMQVPLGVVMMIYEARPNVAIEAAALCIKSGNACLLKGGKEAVNSNQYIGVIWQQALQRAGIDLNAVSILNSGDRDGIDTLLQQSQFIDLVIPRGGESLIRYVSERSKIPVIQHYKGVCHIYVSNNANLEQALLLLKDGKTSRPAVCNALEGLLIHQQVAPDFLMRVSRELPQIKLLGCERSCQLVAAIEPMQQSDIGAEFLDLRLMVRVVEDTEQAIDHINVYGSQHTEVIVSDSLSETTQFIQAVDASAVMVNASSRFNDGGALGLGAEIGISTTKLHAYGPMGLNALTTKKYIIHGNGHVRQS